MKKATTNEQYKLIENSQNSWTDQKQNDNNIINEFIFNHGGTMYFDVAASDYEEIIKNRAEFLKQIYLIHTDQITNSSYNYESSQIEPIDYYLYDKDPKRFDKININKNGDVEYKGKVLFTDDGKPLNNATAYTTVELKILFAAISVEPREGCDPGNTAQNGTLGCYIDIPDDN